MKIMKLVIIGQITTTNKFLEYETKITARKPVRNNTLDTDVAVPLKNLNNFWRSLDLPLINCEIELDLSWSKYCIVSEILRTFAPANPTGNPPTHCVPPTQTTGTTF